MTSNAPEPMSTEELMRHGYLYFVQAVATLAAAPDKQCELMGDYNVAWEIKDDVSAGRFLVVWDQMNSHQSDGIRSLIAALGSVPEDALRGGQGRQVSLEAMNNPTWIPLREQARRLLVDLQPLSDANAQWFRTY